MEQDRAFLDLDTVGVRRSPWLQALMRKIYTLKELLKQPDKDEFAVAMHTEIQHMFTYVAWEKVSI
eukprot:12019040-Ditylum_brightwellii.AAC.1